MGIVCGLIFGVAGLFLLILGFRQFRTSKASVDWPSVEGQVSIATVEMKVESGDNGTSRKYSPRVVYNYSVAGQQYTSDQVVIGARAWYPSQIKAETKLMYQSGQQVTVYYDPENPDQAVLEAGATRGAWGTLAIGIVFTILGTVLMIINITNTFGQ